MGDSPHGAASPELAKACRVVASERKSQPPTVVLVIAQDLVVLSFQPILQL